MSDLRKSQQPLNSLCKNFQGELSELRTSRRQELLRSKRNIPSLKPSHAKLTTLPTPEQLINYAETGLSGNTDSMDILLDCVNLDSKYVFDLISIGFYSRGFTTLQTLSSPILSQFLRICSNSVSSKNTEEITKHFISLGLINALDWMFSLNEEDVVKNGLWLISNCFTDSQTIKKQFLSVGICDKVLNLVTRMPTQDIIATSIWFVSNICNSNLFDVALDITRIIQFVCTILQNKNCYNTNVVDDAVWCLVFLCEWEKYSQFLFTEQIFKLVFSVIVEPSCAYSCVSFFINVSYNNEDGKYISMLVADGIFGYLEKIIHSATPKTMKKAFNCVSNLIGNPDPSPIEVLVSTTQILQIACDQVSNERNGYKLRIEMAFVITNSLYGTGGELVNLIVTKCPNLFETLVYIFKTMNNDSFLLNSLLKVIGDLIELYYENGTNIVCVLETYSFDETLHEILARPKTKESVKNTIKKFLCLYNTYNTKDRGFGEL
ncbi:hypothetical protein EIN_229630 [Entamoeba invadens IP1]|uniref:Importin subunit alpha n=1 Tax=Entamoeba invadens IP1 TaxID=370355 RepID=A0A0A1U6B7_ENTIV|nr:hypothetical protein EIN_229630 [Entamoeba invadens IP1]ELP88430.1 hypothetical protein EIN_229630 [Entamoeba invadens IP1]|eukprot:XP_004255201.1 hypothetical protein EIN_229630 [Entamoeba invadens IP1]